MGGLGVKDLYAMNDALAMKFLWKIEADGDAQWVQLVKAKYLPRKKSIWHSKRTYKCSLFWKNIMGQREALLPMVTWKVGNGETCPAFAPWIEGAMSQRPLNLTQKKLNLKDLLQENSGQWDVQILIQLFGYATCVSVLATKDPPRADAGEDMFVFKESPNGAFSVKRAYKRIMNFEALSNTVDKVLYEKSGRVGRYSLESDCTLENS